MSVVAAALGGPTVVVVGAGPAGMRAAEQLVLAGVRPVVIDEAPRHGGQVYRQPPTEFARSADDLYGAQASRASALLGRFDTLLPQIDYRPDTLVWQHEGQVLQLMCRGRPQALPYDALLLATGAIDRVLPFVGWTLPGVYTLGAAQVALKYQASLIGPRVVFAGTGPLLYLVAWQYASHGGQVAAVLDAAPRSAKLRALPQLMARPRVALQGMGLVARLGLRGVPIHHGVRLLQAHGSARVTSLSWTTGGVQHQTPCDAIAVGHGLRSETQLADLAGCAFAYNALEQAWLPQADDAGRSSVRGVYLAGDGAAILGADAAELSGARAALAALQDLGFPVPPQAAPRLERKLRVQRRFRQGLETAFPLPADWAAEAPDELMVCRCEEISAGELRACVQDTGCTELNQLKAQSRIGMGRCQGRLCAPAAARLLAQAVARPLSEVGRLRGQAPVKPLPIGLWTLAPAGELAVGAAVDERDD